MPDLSYDAIARAYFGYRWHVSKNFAEYQRRLIQRAWDTAFGPGAVFAIAEEVPKP